MSRASRSLRLPLLTILAGGVIAGIGLVAATRAGGAPSADPAAAAVAAPAPADAGSLTADPELAAYVEAARRAELRGDPLLRCLTYPDWPGASWPTGLAAAHCHHAFDPVPSLAEVAAALATADLVTLDARYAELLARHHDEEHSESIHVALARFDASADAATVSAQWLELAPDSGWALLARASHLHAVAMAALAAGGEPLAPDQRALVAAHAAAAADAFRQALAIDPNLLPAQVGLAELALALGDDAGTDAALVAGEAIDPACLPLVRARLARLSPRHGGTYESAHAHLAQLRAAHPQRVLLALAGADEAIEAGRTMLRHERFDEAQLALRPALAGSTAPEAFEDAALATVRASRPDHASALGLLLAAARFQPGRTNVRELRARLLMAAGERTWALDILDDAPGTPAGPLLAQSGGRRTTEPVAR